MPRPNSLVAAAEVLKGTRFDDPKRQKQSWQQEAWSFYHDSGPLRFAANWISNLISRARLQAAKVSPGGEPEPLTSGPAVDAVEALAGGLDGQTAMLKAFGTYLTVPGVGYLVATDRDDGTAWKVYSEDVIRLKRPATPLRPAIYELQLEAGRSWEELPVDTLVTKVWRPDEQFYWMPDSPARAALPALRELRRIGQYIDAVLSSRIASAGLLIFPTEASFPTAAGKDRPEGVHPFVTEVMDVMSLAVQSPGTALQLVPIPVEVAADLTDKFKHLDFATLLSDQVMELRSSALRQGAIALDVPAEVLTGMGEMSHWGAWQIEESGVKIHAEPLLEVITGAVTKGYLVPYLEAQGEDTEGLIVWANTANLKTRPDRSRSAVELYDRGEVDGDALRRETGMSEHDKPNQSELEDWAYKKIITQPTLAPTALVGLGIKPPTAPPIAGPGANPNGQGPRPDQPQDPNDPEEAGSDTQGPPTTRDQGRQPPAGTPPAASLLLFEQVVLRALERAGNKIRSTYRSQMDLSECPPEQAHCCVQGVENSFDLLDKAWDRVPQLAGELGLSPVWTVKVLNDYCSTLLERGFAYDREGLECAIRPLFDQVVA